MRPILSAHLAELIKLLLIGQFILLSACCWILHSFLILSELVIVLVEIRLTLACNESILMHVRVLVFRLIGRKLLEARWDFLMVVDLIELLVVAAGLVIRLGHGLVKVVPLELD